MLLCNRPKKAHHKQVLQNLQVIRLQVSLATKGNLIDNSSVDNGEITAMKNMHI